MKEIYLAGGCFWGMEHFFKQVKGVTDTETGFANGHTHHPSYEEVYTDTTGFAETVRVRYDETVISLEQLLRLYFAAIDPTSLNQQGEDRGTRYRTGIYYTDLSQLPVIDSVFAAEQSKYEQSIVVEVRPLECFFAADEYHQDYLDKHPNGYCHISKRLFAMARDFNK